ncbi:MAG TPA: ATP-binding cassette domain-containing protein [Caulobacter sp.]|nr:ATP-binding cassette domain-containing protein [Caulobacter sp.]
MICSPTLEIEELTAARNGTAVSTLRRLHVGPGQTALLVGPSGAGKTSTLLALAGLAQILGGRARLGDAELTALGPRDWDRFRARQLGFVFQDIHLVAGLSTLDNVLLGCFAGGLAGDRVRAEALLADLGLAEKARRPAERLSRGEAQRVAVARAMLNNPRLILADEPTASLDDQACETVFELLRGAARATGAALVIATHDSRLRARGDVVARVEPAR